jgi:hypothetical protein
VLRISEVVRNEIWLLDDIIQAAPDQTGDDTPPENPVLYIIADAYTSCIASYYPQAYKNGNDIHQSIPCHVKRTKT